MEVRILGWDWRNRSISFKFHFLSLVKTFIVIKLLIVLFFLLIFHFLLNLFHVKVIWLLFIIINFLLTLKILEWIFLLFWLSIGICWVWVRSSHISDFRDFPTLPASYHLSLWICGCWVLLQFSIIPCFILRCHIVIRLFLIFIHVEPFGTHMLHNFLRRPVRVLFFELFSVLLTEVDISR